MYVFLLISRVHAGAGVAFGPDVVREFLAVNDLKMIVRSHECVMTGFHKPFVGESVMCASDWFEDENCEIFVWVHGQRLGSVFALGECVLNEFTQNYADLHLLSRV